ncbi:aspartyl protease family protein [Bacillus shivajii]|uniref:aspartyl protease family protein n=1 Tax=Bacillus shivajii TaxID=1983719 RepID=UPI001CFAA82F|nr:aspartyl protease family protein [Bacillus shivajii]UCZ54218.1 aspartyl protease family protein [Bacillus shivajii]
MKNLIEEDGVLLTEMAMTNAGNELNLQRVLVNTGVKNTVISSDAALKLGLITDEVDTDNKEVEFIKIGNITIHDFEVGIFSIDELQGYDGILGIDFLKKVGAVINLGSLTLYKANVK